MVRYWKITIQLFMLWIDHDRLGSHNWIISEDKKLLSWDSGLGWNYGPLHGNIQLL